MLLEKITYAPLTFYPNYQFYLKSLQIDKQKNQNASFLTKKIQNTLKKPKFHYK